jgi:antitoxin (DNA-binding transcriptional repressor) of toxin-antitoxin stability system
MKQYTPKQLQENLDEILQEAQAGSPVEILREGLAIAIIIKPGQSCGNGSDEFFSFVEGRSPLNTSPRQR